ncbi:YtnP family quorum-quenching lactonase [Brevibacillus fulvus]|uniref:Glyoxylase-like metal-dependent hydrolase (Beta-lactamase superfamily II) n=1 Tax=Brevibacillus fulvus TaxID=1125967 RepID=A0A938XVM4_9BACL|nr:MBL fold metallo-hydrolase [Brevibacillus fulvus]MBM7590977.1 glyoxylase-like metal-dependent hydrolase (beta-lactamase superfamily II) [Brevibacillus fulvus]
MNQLKIGQYSVTWLRGGMLQLDGGAMFGVVPKPLWTKKYPSNELNQIPLRTDPLLIEGYGKRILVEAGIGVNRLTDKQKRNFGVLEESQVSESLAAKQLTPADIDMILMTHMHYDHANGLVAVSKGNALSPAFPNAEILVQAAEWEEMRNPNIRSRNTYWEENWRPIEQMVKTFDSEWEVLPGLTLYHTGGHSYGHAVFRLESEGEVMLHLADLLPTHAHLNPLWVMAYDDYPMTSIFAKQKWLEQAAEQQAWLSFYHDALYRAIKITPSGEIVSKIELAF